MYACDDSDNWVEHYTPYTYPHPLREVASSSGTAATISGSIQTPLTGTAATIQ
jgi:hypothetical protein